MKIKTIKSAIRVSQFALTRKIFYSHLRALSVSVALATCGSQAFAVTTYKITQAVQRDPVTNAITNTTTYPKGINKAGQILGGCSHCTVFNPLDSSVTNITALTGGGTWRLAYGINAAGQVAGSGGLVAGLSVRNPDGSVINLGELADHAGGWTTAISDTGWVAGSNGALSGGSGWCRHRAVIGNVAGGPLQLLGSLNGSWSYPYGINNNSQVVGQAAVRTSCSTYGNFHAFVSTSAGMKDLHVTSGMPDPIFMSTAYAINDNGIAVGNYAIGGGVTAPTYHAAVWNTTANTYVDLGRGNFSSTLYGINASGEVVGSETDTTGMYAVIGNANGGGLIDLNTIVPTKPANVSLIRAVGINDAGQIAVEGTGGSAFLLTPTGVVATPTPAPSNVVATVVTSSKITLTWADNATNETAQSIERCYVYNMACSTVRIQVGANVTSYTDTGFTSGYAYFYRIRALSAAGESHAGTSNFANTGAPTGPTGLRTSLLSTNQATIEWYDNAYDETSYMIDRLVCGATTCSTKNKVSLPANSTRYTITGLTRNSEYTYRVWAVGRFGGSIIQSITFKTLP